MPSTICFKCIFRRPKKLDPHSNPHFVGVSRILAALRLPKMPPISFVVASNFVTNYASKTSFDSRIIGREAAAQTVAPHCDPIANAHTASRDLQRIVSLLWRSPTLEAQ